MSKYIDAEKLISEILKLRSESCISESDDYYEYAKSEIINIIESLHHNPTERPEVDLEKEYKEYVEDDPVFSILTNRNVGLAIARHFYNIGKNDK